MRRAAAPAWRQSLGSAIEFGGWPRLAQHRALGSGPSWSGHGRDPPRTAGFSLAYSLATTLGGSSLAISIWLIERTGDKAAPGYWMSFAAICGLVATLALYRGRAEVSSRLA
jgi:hypothetical protein